VFVLSHHTKTITTSGLSGFSLDFFPRIHVIMTSRSRLC